MKTSSVTLMKEDILLLGRLVQSSVQELSKILRKDDSANFLFIENIEEKINENCQSIEEKCLDILSERKELTEQEIRTIVGSTLIATKFERLADHTIRIAKYVTWLSEVNIEIPKELDEMTNIVSRTLEDILLVFLTDNTDKIPEIIQRDASIDYLHDCISKKLLLELGNQNQEDAQTSTRLLFCTRYLERMGDACTSIAKRIYFIVKGTRINSLS